MPNKYNTTMPSTGGVSNQAKGSPPSAKKPAERRSRSQAAAKTTSTATPRRRRGAPSSKAAEAERRAQIRAWAHANGYPVSARGRVKDDIVAAYEAAQ